MRSRVGISSGRTSLISTMFLVRAVMSLLLERLPPMRRMSGRMVLGATRMVDRMNFLGWDRVGLPIWWTVSLEMRVRICLISLLKIVSDRVMPFSSV